MRKTLLFIALLTVSTALFAQDLTSLSDDFSTPESLAKWQRFDVVEKWPDMLRRAAIADGNLILEPYTSGWYAEFHAPFLFKEVQGSFMVTARLRVRGKEKAIPTEAWSLAGLMVREPRKDREPRGENWLFLTTGVADDVSQPVFETKTTVNSRSNLKLTPAKAGWVELRIVRVGPAFILLSRYEGEPWQVRERFYRMDFARTAQVGVNVYTGWNSAREFHNDPQKFNTTVLKDRAADAILEVDWIRFADARVPRGTNVMALDAATDEQLLGLFGI